VHASEGEPTDEVADNPAENPFVREPRSQRGLRPRGERRANRAADAMPEAALDPAILPPAIGIRAAPEPETVLPESEPGQSVPMTADETPAPKRRGRPRKNPLPEAAATAEG
jgi:hypothetical protein